MIIELNSSNASAALIAEANKQRPKRKPVSAATFRSWAKKAGFQVVAREGEPGILLVIDWRDRFFYQTEVFDSEHLEISWEMGIRAEDNLLEARPRFGSLSQKSGQIQIVNDILHIGGVVPAIIPTPGVRIVADVREGRDPYFRLSTDPYEDQAEESVQDQPPPASERRRPGRPRRSQPSTEVTE